MKKILIYAKIAITLQSKLFLTLQKKYINDKKKLVIPQIKGHIVTNYDASHLFHGI